MDNQDNTKVLDNNIKTLWVLLSALGLLIIVGTAGFIFFSPDKQNQEIKPVLAATTLVPEKAEEPAEIDPIELARNDEELPGLLENPEDTIEIEIEGQTEFEEDIKEESEVVAAAPVIELPAEPQYKEVTVLMYWIQVGSYGSLTKAESVSAYMKDKGLASTVQSKNVNGKAVYRVRIGAFNTKEEAEKFSSQVKSLEGYEESFVIQSPTVKQVALNS